MEGVKVQQTDHVALFYQTENPYKFWYETVKTVHVQQLKERQLVIEENEKQSDPDEV